MTRHHHRQLSLVAAGPPQGDEGPHGGQRATYSGRTWGLVALVAIATSHACAADMPMPYPTADTTLGERLYPGEAEIGKRLAVVIDGTVRRQYQGRSARRDAHPKAHGCVKAEFQVDEKLPPRLAQGVFVPGKSYQAWVRFSNGNPDANKPDTEGSERGMSIKLLGVPGDKLLESERSASTQDFIMMSHPAFFLKDPSNVVPFFEQLGSDSLLDKLKVPFTLGLSQTLLLLKINTLKISNPMQTHYWSPVPYQLGTGPERQVIKFSARACTPTADITPSNAGPNFLREVMVKQLSTGPACMEFLVQPKTSNKLDVEDAQTEWAEVDAPSYKVATIRIPQQQFDSPAQHTFCENLSFTPWHALPEHRPLGGINRLRKVVYEQISSTRHQMNAAPRQEP